MTSTKTNAGAIDELLHVMRRLRAPEGGCPWDREQSFETIAPYTIEEAYEVADAIEKKDKAALKDELGDLLFQVVYHAQMAEEDSAFAFADVVDAIIVKMKRRHPHVFAEAQIVSADAQTKAWEAHKAAERAEAGISSVLDGIPLALPALLRAVKLQKRMQRVGFDWPEIAGVFAKLQEELSELQAELEVPQVSRERIEDEFGDLLFVCANLSRFLGVEPETALRRANAKVERRFRAVEAALAARGLTPEKAGLAEMDRLWDTVKKEERLY